MTTFGNAHQKREYKMDAKLAKRIHIKAENRGTDHSVVCIIMYGEKSETSKRLAPHPCAGCFVYFEISFSGLENACYS